MNWNFKLTIVQVDPLSSSNWRTRKDSNWYSFTLRIPDHYAECYPGMTEMDDAIDDSDEEADYSKMDLVSFKVEFF